LFGRPFPGADVRLFGQADSTLRINNLKVVPAEQQNLPSAALGWHAGGEIPSAPDDPQGRKAIEPFFEVHGEVQSAGDIALLHGRAGKARFDLPSEPLLPRWIRSLRQLLQKRYQV
jgi:putative peptide zinc metalloprotease protein